MSKKSWMEVFMHGTGLWGDRKPDKPYHLALGGVLCLCATDGAAFVAIPTDTGEPNEEGIKRQPPAGLISPYLKGRSVRLDALRKWAGDAETVMWAFDEDGCGPNKVMPDREGELFGGVVVDRNRLAHILQAFSGDAVTVWCQGPRQAVMLANASAVAILMPRIRESFQEKEQAITEELDRQRAHEAGMAS